MSNLIADLAPFHNSSGYGLFAAGLTFRPEVIEHDRGDQNAEKDSDDSVSDRREMGIWREALAAVQLRLRVALGSQTLTVKLRLLPGWNTVQIRGDPQNCRCGSAATGVCTRLQFRKL